jgi:DNA end-binding protein Ku
MARAMWSGVVSFGLVTIPVKLHTATSSHGISFRQVHSVCNTRIKEIRWCPHCDKEVEWSEVSKGYEYAKNHFIQLTDEDFENLPLPSKNTVEVAEFVAVDEVDPIYFDSCYFLEADKGGQKPYALLTQVLESKKMAGIATIALRTKERYCMVRPFHNTLMVQTLLFPDEIKIDSEAAAADVRISAQERKMAESLVDALSSKFEPEKFKDNYKVALKKLIDSKLEGEDISVETADEQGGNTLDLMEALQASIEQSKRGAKGNAGSAPPRKSRKVSSSKTSSRKELAVKSKSKVGKTKSAAEKTSRTKTGAKRTGRTKAA